MAATTTAIDIVRAILVALGVMVGGAMARPVAISPSAEPSWAVDGQNQERQVVPLATLPEYLAKAPLILGERLPMAQAEESETVIPGFGTVVWGKHAEDKHGWDAMKARAATVAGGPGSFWNCRDPYSGREKIYAINQILERTGDGRLRALWTLTVLLPLGDGRFMELTSFVTTDQGRIKSILERDGCQNPWRYVHP